MAPKKISSTKSEWKIEENSNYNNWIKHELIFKYKSGICVTELPVNYIDNITTKRALKQSQISNLRFKFQIWNTV